MKNANIIHIIIKKILKIFNKCDTYKIFFHTDEIIKIMT